MKPDQKEIVYLTGDSRAVVESSPHLEAYREAGYEVLYLTDPVDELVVEALTSFEDKPVRSAAKGAADLGSEEERERVKQELEKKSEEYGGLLSRIQEHLKEQVKEVRLSGRLTSSPACLVGAEHDLSPQLERMLRSSQVAVPKQLRILELNPKHPVVARLRERWEADGEDPMIADAAELLYGSALIAEGSELPDPARFNSLLAELMGRGL